MSATTRSAEPGQRPTKAETNRHYRSTNARSRVYVVTNPAWPDYVKVGKTSVNPKGRLAVYNCSDPFRSYEYAALVEVGDAHETERLIHQHLDNYRVGKTEWFKVRVHVAVHLVRSFASTPAPVE